jgi:PTH1 family peptidyl-tRNA hydrolase
MVIDELAKRHNVKLSTHKSRTDIAAYKLGVGVDAFSVILAKSKSYMNESGGPIKALANFYSVEPQQVIVFPLPLFAPRLLVATMAITV